MQPEVDQGALGTTSHVKPLKLLIAGSGWYTLEIVPGLLGDKLLVNLVLVIPGLVTRLSEKSCEQHNCEHVGHTNIWCNFTAGDEVAVSKDTPWWQKTWHTCPVFYSPTDRCFLCLMSAVNEFYVTHQDCILPHVFFSICGQLGRFKCDGVASYQCQD